MNDNAFIPYAKPSINQIDIDEMGKALSSNTITRGPLVETFESAIAHYCGVRYAVAFNSGSAGLMAAYFAADIGVQDRVITTPNTFAVTTGAAVLRGATPLFLDIDRASGNFDLTQLKYTLEKPYSRGRSCIVPVHFAGIPVDMQQIDRMICDPNIVVIEDAAHALGSHYTTGEKVGCCLWSDMTVFSFHPAKTITTGEGGMVTTNNAEYYRRLKLFRNNGIERDARHMGQEPAPWLYEVQAFTGNYNFTEFQAALGLSQLSRLDQFVEKRRQLMRYYRKLLKDIPNIRLFSEAYDEQTSYHLCVVQIDFTACGTTREKLMGELYDRGIGTQVHYIPLYKHPAMRKICGEIDEYFPETEKYYAEALSLPLYADLKEAEIDHVVKELKSKTSGITKAKRTSKRAA